MNDLSSWVPMRVYWQDSRPMVDWGFLGTRRFTEPFFAQTLDSCVRHPADLLFRHQTPLENLGEVVASQPGLRPTGFIFHMSRCGSTLLAQMLASIPQNLVLSEAAPIDDILRGQFHNREITEEQRVQWLRWMVGVLGRRRDLAEKHLFIKFDCWQVMLLPLIRRAFPDVPWIFLYREPLEVMVSAQNHLGGQMLPGVLEPGLFDWDHDMVGAMSLYEYAARALARLCEAALVQAQAGKGKLVNYWQLSSSLWPALMDYWKVEFTEEETSRMLGAARMNSKNPVLPFEADSQAKRDTASEDLRDLTQQWLEGVYQQLEAQRLVKGFA